MSNGSPSLADTLRTCAVRVDVGGEPKGTGFYADYGAVVTCAHVIESSRLSPGEISVVDADDRRWAVTSVKPHEHDLAVLVVDAQPDHACVLLDPELQPRDPLHSFGYPKGSPEGVPTSFASEGKTGGEPPALKVADGQAQPGMSGSPVLNLRTGAVCAILSETRDERQPLGGYGILVSTLSQVDPQLKRSNELFHEKNQAWYDLLPQDRKVLVRAGWRGKRESESPPIQFVLSVGPADTGLTVRADVFPSRETIGPTPIDLNTVRRLVARLLGDWASRGRVAEGEQIRLLGTILYSALFPGAIKARFEEILAQRKDSPVLVSLRFEPETEDHLVTLPWEYLYVEGPAPSDQIYLARDPSIAFARSILLEPAEEPTEPLGASLSVLLVAMRPKTFPGGPPGYDPALVDQIVAHATDAAKTIDGLELDVIDSPDTETLAARVDEQDFDVVHYLGFGRFKEPADALALGSSNTPEGIDYFPIGVLADALREAPPRFVVLQLCHGLPSDIQADFALLAPELLGKETRAVAAYQYPVDPEPAWKFNETLYTELARGSGIATAVQQGRFRLRFAERPRASIAPALFLYQPGDLRLTSRLTERVSRQPAGVSGS